MMQAALAVLLTVTVSGSGLQERASPQIDLAMGGSSPPLSIINATANPGEEAAKTPAPVGGEAAQTPAPASAQAPAPALPPLPPSDGTPRIFVYDLPTEFNKELLAGMPECETGVYSAEVVIWKQMLESKHRVADPSTANMFFVPFMSSCFIRSKQRDFGGDFPKAIDPTKAKLSEVVALLKTKGPYWNRNGGRDHVWPFVDDLGTCLAPNEIRKASLFLTHNDESPVKLQTSLNMRYASSTSSNALTNSLAANSLSGAVHHLSLAATNGTTMNQTLHSRFGHVSFDQKVTEAACVEASRVIIVPPHVKLPEAVSKPGDDSKRDMLAFFQGTLKGNGKDASEYSNGVRQALYEEYKDSKEVVIKPPPDQYIMGQDRTPEYLSSMQKSTFCVAPRGWAPWSPRISESVLLGCIPVVVADNLQLPFSNYIAYNEVAVQIPEKDVKSMQKQLVSIDQEKIQTMQQKMKHVRHHFLYDNSLPPPDSAMHLLVKELSRILLPKKAEAKKGDKKGRGRYGKNRKEALQEA